MRIAGVILAGGLARRMGGGDKALVEVGGQTLLGRVIARLKPQVGEAVLNANGDPARFAGFKLPVIPDTVEGFAGPLAGVLAGMCWAAPLGYTHVASAAGDTPFFPADLVARLATAVTESGSPIAIAATDEPGRGVLAQPTFGLWPVALAGDLEAALCVESLRKIVVWAARHGCARAVFDATAHPFFNINTPEDIVEAERILKERA